MRRLPHVLFAVVLLPVLAMLPLGCSDDDQGTDPGVGACSIDIYTPVSKPDSLKLFYSNDDINIRWHASGGGNVLIELLKGDALVDTIVDNTPNDGYHYFKASTLGATSGDDFGIRVASKSSDGCEDTVPIRMINTIGCVLIVTIDPDTALVATQQFEITWDSENTSGRRDVELWKGALAQKEYVGTIALDVGGGSYLWENVDSFHAGTGDDYYFVVRDRVVDGCEGQGGPVSIYDPDICYIDISSPIEDQVVSIGSQLNIVYDPVNTSGTVNISLYAGAIFVPNGYIATDVAATGQFTWTVTDFDYEGVHNFFRIRIQDAGDGEYDPYCFGRSERFTIE